MPDPAFLTILVSIPVLWLVAYVIAGRVDAADEREREVRHARRKSRRSAPRDQEVAAR